MSRLEDLLAQVRAEILTARIDAAIQRDADLTPAELAALLEAYREAVR